MSINGVSAYSNWWQQPSQATAGSNTTTIATATAASDSITNAGSLAATGNVSAFMQAFSADVKAMLTEGGSNGGTATASAATGSTSQTGSNQAPGAVHPHHHHHPHGGGENGSMDNAAQQLTAEIDPMLQSGSLSPDQTNQSASAFATDVMQALQSYGTTTPTATGPSILA
jgi:hypothetical protein